MSSGLSVKLPFTVSETFGAYNLNTTFKELAKQNLKMLILTIPGERIMDPSFGVGLPRYLFEFNGAETYDEINNKIRQQVAKYLPYIAINKIDFRIPEGNPDLFPNSLSVAIIFNIVPLRTETSLQINIDN